MYNCVELKSLEDYFKDYNQREQKGVYFYRITKYNEKIRNFIEKYLEAARISGVWIEGRIPNPDEHNLSYYDEIMGMAFQMEKNFMKEQAIAPHTEIAKMRQIGRAHV